MAYIYTSFWKNQLFHCVSIPFFEIRPLRYLTSFSSYIDAHLKISKRFDIEGLVKKDAAWKSNLRFWTLKLCYKQPELFDLIITVSKRFKHKCIFINLY